MNAIRKPQSESAGEKRMGEKCTAEKRTGIAKVVLCAAVILAAAVLLTGSAAAAPGYNESTVGMENVYYDGSTYHVTLGTASIKVPFNITLSGTESARGFFIRESGSSSEIPSKITNVDLTYSWNDARNGDAKVAAASSTSDQFAGASSQAFRVTLNTSDLPAGTYTLKFSVDTAWSSKNNIDDAAVSDWKNSAGTASFTFTVEDAVTITYNGNGATAGTMNPQKVPYGATVRLNKNKYERPNHFFVAWNTQPDGTGTVYRDASKITVYENTTLYAQWGYQKSGPTGTSILLSGSTLNIKDITSQFSEVLPLTDLQIKVLRSVYPEYAVVVETNLSAARDAGIQVVNGKGCPSVAPVSVYHPDLDLVLFTKVYEVIASRPDVVVTEVTLPVPIESVTESGLTIDDVTIYYYQPDYNLWTPLDTLQITVGGPNYYYTVETDSLSYFGVLIKRFDTEIPYVPVTPASPAPFAGLLAGLGAAGAVLIFRRK